MGSIEEKNVEQVPLDFIVKNAYETFSKSVLSTRAKVLLIGGFTDEVKAVKAYLSRIKPNIDRRKKLSNEDSRYVDGVERYAESTNEYVDWVRSEGGQPVWKESLVSHCTAFENCLKSIAVAFFLAKQSGLDTLEAQIFIPSKELTSARRAISRKWDDTEIELPKVRSFFETSIRTEFASKLFPDLNKDAVEKDWDICSAAFQVRNAIIHNLGFMPTTVSLGELALHASWPVDLNARAVDEVQESFSNILYPFSDSAFLMSLL